MLLSGLLHLFLPGETERHMSCPRNVRIVGAILLTLVLPAAVWGFYVLAVLFVAVISTLALASSSVVRTARGPSLRR